MSQEPAHVFAKNVQLIEDHSSLITSAPARDRFKSELAEGQVFIAKRVIPAEKLRAIREYLARVGRSSLPNYRKIEEGAPNFHRINRWDERSYVAACFHQFSFFPWNQDVFGLFDLCKDVYRVRNLVSGLAPDSFLGVKPQDGCSARVSFQFYPSGAGGMNRHVDPYDFHQHVVPIVVMSRKGEDFRSGGAFVEGEGGRRIDVDEFAEIGDVMYFSSQIPHGVSKIDSETEADWLAFQGRWIMLVAVNRLTGNAAIPDSKDLGS